MRGTLFVIGRCETMDNT